MLHPRQDARDFDTFTEAEREYLLRLVSLCQSADEATVLGLLPQESLEEELQLTSALWNGARHADLFARVTAEIGRPEAATARPTGLMYCRVMHEELPAALLRALRDDAPVARAEAAVLYHLIVVGVIVETACDAALGFLARHDAMPALREALHGLAADVARDLAGAIEELSQLVSSQGASLATAIERRARDLAGPATSVFVEELAGGSPALPERAAAALEARLAAIHSAATVRS